MRVAFPSAEAPRAARVARGGDASRRAAAVALALALSAGRRGRVEGGTGGEESPRFATGPQETRGGDAAMELEQLRFMVANAGQSCWLTDAEVPPEKYRSEARLRELLWPEDDERHALGTRLEEYLCTLLDASSYAFFGAVWCLNDHLSSNGRMLFRVNEENLARLLHFFFHGPATRTTSCSLAFPPIRSTSQRPGFRRGWNPSWWSDGWRGRCGGGWSPARTRARK